VTTKTYRSSGTIRENDANDTSNRCEPDLKMGAGYRKLLLVLGRIPIILLEIRFEEWRWIAFANLVLGMAPKMQFGKLVRYWMSAGW